MNSLSSLLSAEWTQALGWTLVHSIWQGAIIAILLAIAMVFLQRFSARLRYMIYCLSLLVLFGASIVTFFKVYERPIVSTNYNQGQQVTDEKPVLIILADAVLRQHTTSGIEEYWNAFSDYVKRNMPLLVGVWLIGLMIFLLRLLGSLAYTQRLRYYKVYRTEEKWEHLLKKINHRMGVNKSVQLMQSAAIQVPVALGFFRPVILVPVGFFMQLPADQIETVFMHELAHIKRKDYFINLIQSAVEAIFFYHPAVWWISGNIRMEREHISDDIAILYCKNPILYANALAAVQEMKLQNTVLAPALTRNKYSLLNRIQRMMKRPRLIPNYAEGFISVMIILITIAAISATAAISFKADEALVNMMDFKSVNTESINDLSAGNIETEFIEIEKRDVEPIRISAKRPELTDITSTNLLLSATLFPDSSAVTDSLKKLQQEKIEKARQYMEQAEQARLEYRIKLKQAREQQKQIQQEFSAQLEEKLKANQENYKKFLDEYRKSLQGIYSDSNITNIVIRDDESGNIIVYGGTSPFRFEAKMGTDSGHTYNYEFHDIVPDGEDYYFWTPGDEIIPGFENRVFVVDELDSLADHDIDIFVEPDDAIMDVYMDARIDKEARRVQAHADRIRDEVRDIRFDDRVWVKPDRNMRGYLYESKLNRIVKDELENDRLIKRHGDYIIKLDNKRMYINGEKQSRSVYKKYRNLIESFEGEEMSDEFEFKMVL